MSTKHFRDPSAPRKPLSSRRARGAIIGIVLGTAELCDRLCVHENTVASWRKEGLPSYPAGNALLYRWNEVAAWLELNDREGYVMRAEVNTRQGQSSPERRSQR